MVPQRVASLSGPCEASASEAICEIIATNRKITGTDKMVRALQRRTCLVDHVQVSWMIQGDPQNGPFQAGTSDEIEITLVPRDEWSVAHDEGTRPVAAGCVRNGSASEDSRTPEEHVVCTGPQEGRKNCELSGPNS